MGAAPGWVQRQRWYAERHGCTGSAMAEHDRSLNKQRRSQHRDGGQDDRSCPFRHAFLSEGKATGCLPIDRSFSGRCPSFNRNPVKRQLHSVGMVMCLVPSHFVHSSLACHAASWSTSKHRTSNTHLQRPRMLLRALRGGTTMVIGPRKLDGPS